MRTLSVESVIKEGFSIGVKNAASLIGAVVLWLLTIWVPYINVGTTIALCSIPVALSKGKVIYPTFIFESKYRKMMGEFLIQQGLELVVFLFLLISVIPAFVLSYSWSQGVYLLIDKEMNPLEALTQSNKLTYGYKWKLFFIDILIFVCIFLALLIFGGIARAINETFCLFVIVVICVLIAPFSLGCSAVIYRQLCLAPAEEPAAEPVAEPAAAPAEEPAAE